MGTKNLNKLSFLPQESTNQLRRRSRKKLPKDLEYFETDLTTLHLILSECHDIKSDLESALILYSNDISSEAHHVEVMRKVSGCRHCYTCICASAIGENSCSSILYFRHGADPNYWAVEVSTFKTGKHGQAKCQFVGPDIFNKKKLEDFVRSSHNCDDVEVSTFQTGKHGQGKCQLVGSEIFNRKKLEDFVRSSHNCDVPQVNDAEFELIDISMDGFVSLLTEMKEALRMIWDPN